MIERLKITGVRAVAVGAGWRNCVFVLIDVDNGVVGLGEASLDGQTHAVLGALKDLEPLLIGADPFRIEHLWQQAYRHAFQRGAAVLSALAGVEVALWDIKAKMLGVPIWRLFGGLTRDKIRAYANGPRGETPDELARSAESLVARGFTAMKFTPFDATPALAGKRFIDAAVAKTRAVRDAVGPEVELMIDGRGRLSPAMAVRAADALAEFTPMFFEEPCPPEHMPALARVAKKSPIPIAAGGRLLTCSEHLEALGSRKLGVVQPGIVQCGGIAEARKIAALAEMHFVSVAPRNSWSWVNTVASLHLDAVIPNFLIQEVIADDEPWNDAIVVNPPVMDADGFFRPPAGPGLGVELDLAAAARFPPVTVRPPALWHDDGSVADW